MTPAAARYLMLGSLAGAWLMAAGLLVEMRWGEVIRTRFPRLRRALDQSLLVWSVGSLFAVLTLLTALGIRGLR
jgi:hypothetical protein